MVSIVFPTLFRIIECAIGLGDNVELTPVSSRTVIGEVALREYPINTVDRLLLSIRAYLEDFVIINEWVLTHLRVLLLDFLISRSYPRFNQRRYESYG